MLTLTVSRRKEVCIVAYQDWFDSYRRGEVVLRGYFRPPEELTAERITNMDRSAADMAKRAQALLDDLAEYRQALAERYAALSTMPYNLRLELARVPDWGSGRVKYYVRLVKTYEDSTAVNELKEVFKGQQRRDAIARFEALRKERPGIEAVKDIERRAWEK